MSGQAFSREGQPCEPPDGFLQGMAAPFFAWCIGDPEPFMAPASMAFGAIWMGTEPSCSALFARAVAMAGNDPPEPGRPRPPLLIGQWIYGGGARSAVAALSTRPHPRADHMLRLAVASLPDEVGPLCSAFSRGRAFSIARGGELLGPYLERHPRSADAFCAMLRALSTFDSWSAMLSANPPRELLAWSESQEISAKAFIESADSYPAQRPPLRGARRL